MGSYAYSTVWNSPMICNGPTCVVDESTGYYNDDQAQIRELATLEIPVEAPTQYSILQVSAKLCIALTNSPEHELLKEVTGNQISARYELLYARYCAAAIVLNAQKT